MTRGEIQAEQRRRILAATEELVGEGGYRGLKIEPLLARAQVSYPTLRKRFGDKDGCFRALVEGAAKEARNALREAFAAGEGPWAERVAASFAALLELTAADRGRARAWLAEPFAAGSAAVAWQDPVLEELRAILAEGRQGDAAGTTETALETLAGAVLWSASERLIAGGAERSGEPLDELVELVQGLGLGARSEGSRRRGIDGSRVAARAGIDSQAGVERAWLDPLPHGRHGLSREQVRESQRERLLAAVAEVVGERGFAAARLTDIVTAAAVSRRVFYENFGDKEECFLAALDAVGEHLRELGEETAESCAGDWPEWAVATLDAVLGFFVAEPGLARLCMVESLGAGEAARERYRRAIVSAAAELNSARTLPGAEVSPPAGTAELLVGAVAWQLSRRIALEGSDGLPALLPGLVELLLGPKEPPPTKAACSGGRAPTCRG
jgi:AcrR family transcriptional regulator